MFCTQCGEQLPDDAAFCSSCGSKVDGDISASKAGADQTADNIETPKGKGKNIFGRAKELIKQRKEEALRTKCRNCGAPFNQGTSKPLAEGFICEDCYSLFRVGEMPDEIKGNLQNVTYDQILINWYDLKQAEKKIAKEKAKKYKCIICEKIADPETAVMLSDSCLCDSCAKRIKADEVASILEKELVDLRFSEVFRTYQDLKNNADEETGNPAPESVSFEEFATFYDKEKRVRLLEKLRTFAFSPKYEDYAEIKYENILGAEILEDGTSIQDGGISIATNHGNGVFTGTSIFNDTKEVCRSLQIKVTTTIPTKPAVLCVFINDELNKNGREYKRIYGLCQNVHAKLQQIAMMNRSGSNNTVAAPQEKSKAEQLREFKSLLDDGIITQEEFDAKKKELLT